MTTLHYVDGSGNYIGGFGDGATPPDGATMASSAPPSAFHTWNGSAWIADTAGDLTREREKMVCSLIQAKAALDAADLLVAADAAVTAAGGLTALAWTSANELERNSPTITALQAAMSLSDTEVDDLFRAAMQIKL